MLFSLGYGDVARKYLLPGIFEQTFSFVVRKIFRNVGDNSRARAADTCRESGKLSSFHLHAFGNGAHLFLGKLAYGIEKIRLWNMALWKQKLSAEQQSLSVLVKPAHGVHGLPAFLGEVVHNSFAQAVRACGDTAFGLIEHKISGHIHTLSAGLSLYI